ncbi:MAG: HEAT repeat domain-containing protein [Anaerolineae bacterium]
MNLERVLDHISDEHAPLAHSKLHMLSELRREEMELFADRWAPISATRRRHVIRALVEIAEANFTVDFSGIFQLGLEDEDEEVRAFSIDGLWEDESAALVESLLRMLSSDPSIRVRAAAATGLGRFVLLAALDELEEEEVGRRIVRALWEVIEDPQEALEVHRRVVEAISFSGDEGVREVIDEAYHHRAEKMRVSAIFSMGRSADPAWGSTVIGELTSTNPEMRYEAARACGELEVKEAVPSLMRLIADPDREVQQAAISALSKIGGREARRALELCCESDDEVIATAGDEALGELELTSGIFELPLYEEE